MATLYQAIVTVKLIAIWVTEFRVEISQGVFSSWWRSRPGGVLVLVVMKLEEYGADLLTRLTDGSKARRSITNGVGTKRAERMA